MAVNIKWLKEVVTSGNETVKRVEQNRFNTLLQYGFRSFRESSEGKDWLVSDKRVNFVPLTPPWKAAGTFWRFAGGYRNFWPSIIIHKVSVYRNC